MKKIYKNFIYIIILFILSLISIQIGVKDFSLIGALFNNPDDVFLITISIICTTQVYATNVSNEIISEETKSQLVEIKDKELKSIEDYKEAYGSDTYGLVAYILDKVRVYSIPVAFLGIAISAIYQYVIGIRKLDVRDKGFNAMIGMVTMLIICQVLPLIFAIVVKGWRG